MFEKHSRYGSALVFVGNAFRGVRARTIGAAEGVVEHTVGAGERLDLLALRYYDDDRLWWRIVDANPELICAADLGLARWIGEVIVIPRGEEGRS